VENPFSHCVDIHSGIDLTEVCLDNAEWSMPPLGWLVAIDSLSPVRTHPEQKTVNTEEGEMVDQMEENMSNIEKTG
jgi:hypothetical protein